MRWWEHALFGLVAGGIAIAAALLVVVADTPPDRTREELVVSSARQVRSDLRRPEPAVVAEATVAVADPLTTLEQTLTRNDYAAAARVAQEFPEEEERLQWLLRVASLWSSHDPVAAARFSLTLAAGPERRQVLAVVIDEWAMRDVVAAGTWLGSQELQPDHDGAIAALARRAGVNGAWPELTLAWAENIGDGGVRWEVIREGVQGWALRDEAAARRYVDTTVGLSPAQRAQLKERIRQRTTLLD